MSGLVETLLGMSFDRATPNEANEAIENARRDKGENALSYEVALPALGPDEFLTHRVLPKLAYFLDCRGVKAPASGGVFISLFSPEGLHFIDAGPVVQKLAEARSLTLAEVFRRYGAGGAGDPPLLGG